MMMMMEEEEEENQQPKENEEGGEGEQNVVPSDIFVILFGCGFFVCVCGLKYLKMTLTSM